MKKFIYMILLMGIMFIGANNVGAKTQKFVCDYSADFTSQSGKVVKFSVYVYDDNSVSVSSFDNVNGTDLTARQNMFTEMKFNEHFLSKATEGGNNCPDLGLQTDGLNASITVIRSATEQGVTVMPGTFVEGAGTASETKKETICTREQEMRNNKNINVEFYTIGTSRYWNISYAEGSGSTTGLIAEMITLDGMTFNIGEDVVKNIYDSKNCSSLIYFECPNQATINLTTTKPSDSENCSYSVTTAKNDTGLGVSTSKTTTTVKNPTSSYSSTSTKQCINCNNTYIPYSLSVLSRNIINLVQLLVPVIIIITGMIELLRAVIAGDEKKMDEVKPTLIRKIIAGVIIFLIFAIVKFGFSFLGSRANATLKCVSYFISEEANSVACPTREELENGTYNSGDSSGESGVDKEVFNYCYDDCVRKHGTGNQQYGQCVQECQETTTASDVQEIKNDIFNYCYDDCVREHGTGNQQYGQCVQECQATTTASDVQAAKTEKYNTCSDSCSSQYGTGNQQYGQCLTTCQAS